MPPAVRMSVGRRACLLLIASLGGGIVALPAAALLDAPSLAQPEGLAVEIVDVPGVIDRPFARYIEDRITEAERRGGSIVVLQMDSPGAVKIAAPDRVALPLAERIRASRVPVVASVGPGSARASGGALFLLAAAHVAAASPAARLGPLHPADLGHLGRWSPEEERREFGRLAEAAGRASAAAAATGPDLLAFPIRGVEAADLGIVEVLVPTMDALLRALDGMTATTVAGQVTLRLSPDLTDVRFHKPGPVARMLHVLAVPALLYVLLVGGAMALAFELFQPGFGVAGVSGGIVLAGAAYGLTVAPVAAWALSALIGGMLLLALDVARDGIGVPSVLGTGGVAAGSAGLFPVAQLSIPAWLVALGVVAALLFFVPVMTMVRRARRPEIERAGRGLVGETGEVRSVLNPEGFVWVGEALWRARSDSGERIEAGAGVTVVGARGTLVHVRRRSEPGEPSR